MGSKKTKTTNDPWAPAQPYIVKGMEQTSQTFDQNQPRLQDMSAQAYDAFGRMAPTAFGATPYVSNAQAAAQTIGNGYFLGKNPGQATYGRLQAPSGAGSANPADRFASAVSKGQYLNQQPSAGLYSGMMSQDYLTGNPYLENIISQTNADVSKNANRMFAARGMGAGLSSAFGDVLTKNLANNEGQLRYQNYNDASARQLQAAGQSDAAWNGERGRMDASTGLLAANHNARQDRALEAARAADATQGNQVQQMLTALGLTGDLRNAEYAGVAPTLSLLNAAADTPYIGVGALNGNIRQASDGYGVKTEKTSGGLGATIGSMLGSGLNAFAGGYGNALGGKLGS